MDPDIALGGVSSGAGKADVAASRRSDVPSNDKPFLSGVRSRAAASLPGQENVAARRADRRRAIKVDPVIPGIGGVATAPGDGNRARAGVDRSAVAHIDALKKTGGRSRCVRRQSEAAARGGRARVVREDDVPRRGQGDRSRSTGGESGGDADGAGGRAEGVDGEIPVRRHRDEAVDRNARARGQGKMVAVGDDGGTDSDLTRAAVPDLQGARRDPVQFGVAQTEAGGRVDPAEVDGEVGGEGGDGGDSRPGNDRDGVVDFKAVSPKEEFAAVCLNRGAVGEIAGKGGGVASARDRDGPARTADQGPRIEEEDPVVVPESGVVPAAEAPVRGKIGEVGGS